VVDPGLHSSALFVKGWLLELSDWLLSVARDPDNAPVDSPNQLADSMAAALRALDDDTLQQSNGAWELVEGMVHNLRHEAINETHRRGLEVPEWPEL
jgi:hypothetical protein